MIFDIFAPPQGPRERGPNHYAVASPIYVSNSNKKFGWILSNGLGDSVTDGRTDGRTRQSGKPFGPSPGPQGAGPKKNMPLHAPFM